jgi:hypothetical protein
VHDLEYICILQMLYVILYIPHINLDVDLLLIKSNVQIWIPDTTRHSHKSLSVLFLHIHRI